MYYYLVRENDGMNARTNARIESVLDIDYFVPFRLCPFFPLNETEFKEIHQVDK